MAQATAILVGAGHAGLAMSRRLTERSIDHVVLERGEVANSDDEVPAQVLLALPHRRALLGERPRALPRVLRGEHPAHDPGILVPALGRGPVAAALRALLAR